MCPTAGLKMFVQNEHLLTLLGQKYSRGQSADARSYDYYIIFIAGIFISPARPFLQYNFLSINMEIYDRWMGFQSIIRLTFPYEFEINPSIYILK